MRWPCDEPPMDEATYALAKRAVEKLPEREFRALGRCARQAAIWPGLVEWWHVTHPRHLLRIPCREMDALPEVRGFPVFRDDFGRKWPE